jgi:hypothetical protein
MAPGKQLNKKQNKTGTKKVLIWEKLHYLGTVNFNNKLVSHVSADTLDCWADDNLWDW